MAHPLFALSVLLVFFLSWVGYNRGSSPQVKSLKNKKESGATLPYYVKKKGRFVSKKKMVSRIGAALIFPMYTCREVNRPCLCCLCRFPRARGWSSLRRWLGSFPSEEASLARRRCPWPWARSWKAFCRTRGSSSLLRRYARMHMAGTGGSFPRCFG